MKKILKLIYLISFIIVSSCVTTTYSGNSHIGYSNFPSNNISPEEAIEIAKPYLDKTFELRTEGRKEKSEKEPIIHVTLKGRYYYIVKDNYPAKYIGFYLSHSAKVNKKTGEVLPPK